MSSGLVWLILIPKNDVIENKYLSEVRVWVNEFV